MLLPRALLCFLLFSIAYHQCRWTYVSSEDGNRFAGENIPVDVSWLDIEYAKEHKYLMWTKYSLKMIADVETMERKIVVIMDPHLKRESNHPVYKLVFDLDVLIKPNSGEGGYEGSSSWTDFFNPESWDLWVKLLKTKSVDGSWA